MIVHARDGFLFSLEAMIRNNRKPQPAKTVLPNKQSNEHSSHFPSHIRLPDLGHNAVMMMGIIATIIS
jgi:hypothetical protein